MKHDIKITIWLISLFLVSQIIGLSVVNKYIDSQATQETGAAVFSALPYNIERPPIEEKTSYLFIMAAILLGTILVLLLIKWQKTRLWKIWFFLAVTVCLSIALSPFINALLALGISLLLAAYKVFKPNVIVHNITELFLYGGLAAIFVPLINLQAAFILLILIAIYDVIAVYKIKHMVTMAEFQTKEKLFAGLMINYPSATLKPASKKIVSKETKSAILGGGDIGFPLLFSGVVMKTLIIATPMPLAFFQTLFVTIGATLALTILFMISKKDKYYPAMPFISAGCFLGYVLLWAIYM